MQKHVIDFLKQQSISFILYHYLDKLFFAHGLLVILFKLPGEFLALRKQNFPWVYNVPIIEAFRELVNWCFYNGYGKWYLDDWVLFCLVIPKRRWCWQGVMVRENILW